MDNCEENKRYPAIDGLRTFGIFAIVLFHVLDKFIFRNQISWGVKLEDLLSSLVSLFMIISAFSLCCGYYHKIKENKISLNDFYKKRYMKILPLFLLMTILDIIFSGITKNNLFEGFANATLLFGFLPHSNISIVGVGWFIGVVFAFYLLFPFFIFVSWNKVRAWLFFVISLILRFVSINYFFDQSLKVVHSFIVWIPYFMIGILLYLNREWLEKKLYKIRYIFWLFALSFLVLRYVNPVLFGVNLTDLYRMLSDAILVLIAIVSENKLLSNRITKFFSKISFEIYITHMLFLNALLTLHFDTIVNNYVLKIALIYIFVLMGSTVFAYVLNVFKKNKRKRIFNF